jgi:hypothetical protein
MYKFLLDDLLDGAAAVASVHGGGGSYEHAPASMLVVFLFFVFLKASLTDEVPAMVSQRHHCHFPSASCKSSSNRPFGTGSISLFLESCQLGLVCLFLMRRLNNLAHKLMS